VGAESSSLAISFAHELVDEACMAMGVMREQHTRAYITDVSYQYVGRAHEQLGLTTVDRLAALMSLRNNDCINYDSRAGTDTGAPQARTTEPGVV